MKIRMVSLLIIILLIFAMSNYYKPIQVSDLVNFHSNDVLPEKIETSIYFSTYANKDLPVIGQSSIKKIIEIVRSIKIRKIMNLPEGYRPKLKETYGLKFYSGNNEVEDIYILNNNYIKVNGKTYKILKSSNLSGIYNAIILDQPKDMDLYEFYYNLIDISE